jgi:hypothetical protein
MPAWFDDDKRTLQLLFAVQRQDPLKFRMHGIPGGGQDTEVDHSRSAALDEDEPAEITIASDENSPLLLGHPKQIGVLRLRQAKLSGRNNVMPQAAQESNGGGINILVR